MIVQNVEIEEREWPKPGLLLFSVVGKNYHMSFADATAAGQIPAILMRILPPDDKAPDGTAMILAMKIFDSKEDALAWMIAQMPKWCSN